MRSSTPRSVAVAGDYAYVVDEANDVLQIFDVSNPALIVAKDADGTNLDTPTSVAVSGGYAYVVDQVNALLQIFDVSNFLFLLTNGLGIFFTAFAL